MPNNGNVFMSFRLCQLIAMSWYN